MRLAVHILVDNAGRIPYCAPGFARGDLAAWRLVLDPNLRAPLLAPQPALPTLTALAALAPGAAPPPVSLAGRECRPAAFAARAP